VVSQSSVQVHTIQAAVLRTRRGPLRTETLGMEAPRDDEILVRIVATGICHLFLMEQVEVKPGGLISFPGYRHEEGSGCGHAGDSLLNSISNLPDTGLLYQHHLEGQKGIFCAKMILMLAPEGISVYCGSSFAEDLNGQADSSRSCGNQNPGTIQAGYQDLHLLAGHRTARLFD